MIKTGRVDASTHGALKQAYGIKHILKSLNELLPELQKILNVLKLDPLRPGRSALDAELPRRRVLHSACGAEITRAC